MNIKLVRGIPALSAQKLFSERVVHTVLDGLVNVNITLFLKIAVKIVFIFVIDGFEGLGGAKQNLRIPIAVRNSLYDFLSDNILKRFLSLLYSGGCESTC